LVANCKDVLKGNFQGAFSSPSVKPKVFFYHLQLDI
jgi:hypothetical protein